MTWTLTDDIGTYRAAVTGLLSSQPVRYTVLATVPASLEELGPGAFGTDPPLLGWWSPDGAAHAAVLQTPPHPLLLTAIDDESAGQLASALADRGGALTAVNAAEPDARAFARAWLAVTGQESHDHQRQRLYRLDKLVPPDPAPEGAARIATGADVGVARSWHAAFSAETAQLGPADAVIGNQIRAGRLMVWEAGGQPVSMAGLQAQTQRVARVGSVYTPPGHRGRGYGGAVTAAISRLAAERGADSVILFTDLANPVSNAIYSRLGFRPVEDRVVLRFGD